MTTSNHSDLSSRGGPDSLIVGINCNHDASACVLRNGELVCAVQLERLSRVKRDGRPLLNTRAAVDYCLKALGLDASEVGVFAFNTQNLLPQQVGLGFPLADESFDLFDPISERAVFVSHHLAHAFAAFFCSPFERAAVLVIDGSGGSVVGADDLILRGPQLARYVERPLPTPRPPYHAQSAYVFDERGYRLVRREVARDFHPMCGSSALGETYAAVSQYVFGDWQEGGKLMGLAPYGNAAAFSQSLLERDESGRLQFTSAWKQSQRRVNKRGHPMEYRDLAARVQADLEEAVLDRVKAVLADTGETNLAYAGGVALNSVANQRILCESGIRGFYAMPASHDAGISVGAAAAAHFLLSGRTKGAPVTHDFLGRPYTGPEIQESISRRRGAIEVTPYELRSLVERLQAGQVLGWFEGGSEFGPRALGHRSILAAPFERAMWLHLNQVIKYREEFRPYAPIVLEEHANEIFEMGSDSESPFMLRIMKVRPAWRERLGAVTHADGSARVQTIDRVRLPRLHSLLTAFMQRTGVPVLVNTSMNVRGEPIVETPEQALNMLLVTHMDALVLEDFIVVPLKPPSKSLEDCALTCAPMVSLKAEVTESGLEYRLTCRARGNSVRVVPASVFFLLADADGITSLRELLQRHCTRPSDRPATLDFVRELCNDRLVLPLVRS